MIALLIAAIPAVIVPFQYAWRFHYGDDPTSPPGAGPGTCAFEEEDLQDYALCDGMEHNPNRFSEKDCRVACCYDPTCLVWQGFPLENGRACYHGYAHANVTCKAGGKPSGMGGGRRKAVPPPRTDYSFAADATSSVDHGWVVVDAPHDFISEYGNFTNNVEDFKQGYLPRNASWYRKHFALPNAWQADGGATFVHFEGAFHHTSIFLNGQFLQSHECGYTGFTIRIDNATGLRHGVGDDKANVLAVRTDASFGSGHWYEGGGLYRPVHLVHVAPLHITHDGLFVPSEGDGSLILPSAEIELTDDKAAETRQPPLAPRASGVAVRFTLLDGNDVLATNTTIAPPLLRGGSPAIVGGELRPAAPLVPWSVKTPKTFTVRAETLDEGGKVTDSVEVTAGFRRAKWSASGFELNGDAMTLRGFSHHNSIGGLGVAVPERVNLFRVQASRALGANIWRQSHNPYTPHLYTLLDLLGTMCWDENRDYGAKYMNGAYAIAMRDMVKRDRSHPSIIVWSYCNEFECQQFDATYSGNAFRAAAYSVDGTRPVTANHVGDALLTATIDVQGFSHKNNQSFVNFHKQSPDKPTVLSECCSCIADGNQRVVDGPRGLPSCIAQQNSPALLPYVAGSLGVWTLMDYFGEPHGTGTSAWPYVSSDFGQFDIAGFPKPHAYWYVANWLQAAPKADPGRPPLPSQPVARLLDLPPVGSLLAAATNHSSMRVEELNAIVTAPFAQLLVNGNAQPIKPSARDEFGAFTTMSWSLAASSPCTGPLSFPHNATGVQCHGLTKMGAAADEMACAKACCADGACNTWQLDVGASAKGCWIGHVAVGGCDPPKQGTWVGGQRDDPPPFHGNATLLALSDSAGSKVLGSHTLLSADANASAYRLSLTIDVPSAATGTGDALLLDGRDTALVRAAIVDGSTGALVSTAAHRIMWRVVSGPGRMAGVSNGDPKSHEWMKSDGIAAWGGLARGYVRTTVDCTSAHRELVGAIDLDGALAPTIVVPDAADCHTAPIVVGATAEGLGEAQISIPTSIDAAVDGVFAVAARTASSPSFSYLDSFVG